MTRDGRPVDETPDAERGSRRALSVVTLIMIAVLVFAVLRAIVTGITELNELEAERSEAEAESEAPEEKTAEQEARDAAQEEWQKKVEAAESRRQRDEEEEEEEQRLRAWDVFRLHTNVEAKRWEALNAATPERRCSRLGAWRRRADMLLEAGETLHALPVDGLSLEELKALRSRLDERGAETSPLAADCEARAAEEAAQREAERQRKAEEEAARRKAEEEAEAQRRAEEEARRKAEEEAEAARLRMTVDEIGKQTETNALRFEREFLGKQLTVTGPVDSITTRDDEAYLNLGDWRTGEVICTMRSETARLLDLDAGDTVTVRGRFDDLGNFTEEVEMSDCVLL